jgi:hypothetical protein
VALSWSRTTTEDRVYLEVTGDRGQRALVCALEPRPGQTHFLMPVRLFEGGDAQLAVAPTVSSGKIEAQTLGLLAKIRAIDNLRLSDVRFGDRIAAARMYINAASEEAAWDFAREAVRGLQDQLGLAVASQIDYDQKRMHSTLGSVLESIDFAVRHDPSAIATTIAYEKLLLGSGLALGDAVVAVTGVGDLGSRIVKRFLADGVGRMLVADRDAERRGAVAALPRVEEVPMSEVARAAANAQVLSADNSFTDEIGALWAATPTLIAVGGPEAGLDRFTEARRRLAEAGKEYVPSVLCGSLGLVSNLEESLGVMPDMDKMIVKYGKLIDAVIAHMRDANIGFSDACEAVLNGDVAIRDFRAPAVGV